MKFATDKKPTLCIYTSEVSVETDEEKKLQAKMELEVKSVKKELEATKSALKLQTIRCRQLVSAFTKKLQEKEVQLLASKELRDEQLSRLLRALLVLESRLKQEQKLIRQQLHEKDKIIEVQRIDIVRLSKEARESKLVSADSSEVEEQCRKLWGKDEVDTQNGKTGEERLDSLCRGMVDSAETLYCSEESGRAGEEQKGTTFKDNPVLESVNQILLRDEEDLLAVSAAAPCTKTMPLENGRAGGCEWYETDTSLVGAEACGVEGTGAWCISMVEEGREEAIVHGGGAPALLVKAKDKISSPPIKAQLLEEKACLEMSRKNLTIAQHMDLEEVDTATNKSDRSVSPSYQELKPVLKKETTSASRSLQKPPALPPKPPRLLKPYQILQILQNPRHQHSVPSTHDDRTSDQGDKKYQAVVALNLGQVEVALNLGQVEVALNLGQVEVARGPGQLPTSTRHKHPVPVTRTTASAGKFHVQEMKRNQMNGHIPGNVKPQVTFEDQYESGFAKSPPRTKPQDDAAMCRAQYEPGFAKSPPRTKPQEDAAMCRAQYEPGFAKSPPRTKPQEDAAMCRAQYEPGFAKSPPRTKTKEDAPAPCVAIRMGSSVSSLITGSAGDSIVTELSGDHSTAADSPSHVSDLVKQFEVLGTCPTHKDVDDACELNKNFEEFKLEESYAESLGEVSVETDSVGKVTGETDSRPEGDGAETSNMENHYATITTAPPPAPSPAGDTKMYETFLETTGLSQKSILTPSRMLSNHRSCLKPKDVKHRSKVKAAAISSVSGSTVKYWTEPFL